MINMTKTRSHKNSTHVIIGSRNKPFIAYINSLFKESQQSTITLTLIYSNVDFRLLHGTRFYDLQPHDYESGLQFLLLHPTFLQTLIQNHLSTIRMRKRPGRIRPTKP